MTRQLSDVRSGPGFRAVAGFALAISFLTMAAAGPAFAAAGAIKEFRIPPPGGGPQAIAMGPDGALWFTEIGTDAIGRLGSGGFSFFPLPNPATPYDIVAGPDGALWFTETYGDRIGRITTDGRITEFAVPPCGSCGPYGSGPLAIAVGSDGDLWYTRPAESVIGEATTSGTITEIPIGGVESSPTWLTTGPDGALWFTDSSGIGRMALDGSLAQVWSGLNYPSSIAMGPDGNLWVTGASQDVVARVTAAGRGKLFGLRLNCDPQWIAPGAGSLWVACYNLNEISRVSTTGVVTAFPVPGHIPNYPDVLSGITLGPGGAMWFTEYAGERIGQIATG
jgi:virginiamycin B lyase